MAEEPGQAEPSQVGEWGRAVLSQAGQPRAQLATAASAVPGAAKWAGLRARGAARPGRARGAEGRGAALAEGRSRAASCPPPAVLPLPLPREEPGAASGSLVLEG